MESTVKATSSTAKQFDFARHWKKKIVPLLDCRDVVAALTLGLKLDDPNYNEGDPPWEYGRGPLNGQRAKRGCLSWYQPWGRCHYIAPFCWALGKRLFPGQEWGFITSDWHTVVIGWDYDWENPEWVMDILLFKDKTAEESLAFVKSQEWALHRSLAEYFASFFSDTKAALETLCRLDTMFTTNGSASGCPRGRIGVPGVDAPRTERLSTAGTGRLLR